MADTSDEIITIGGVDFMVFRGLNDEPLMLPHDPIKQKVAFPVDGDLQKSIITASRGISAHTLDPFSAADDKERGLPASFTETGFSAKHLNLLGDDTFYPECWQVLMANDWAENYGRLTDRLLHDVCEHDGVDIIQKSKDAFGDGWDCYIAERASIHLTELFTRVWYAANMLSAYYARYDDLLFGYLWSEYRLKMRAEKNASTGSKVIAGTKTAAEQTNAAHSSLRTARFRLMEQLVPALGTDKAAVECELQGLGSAQAVKRQWNRFQNKKRDT